MCLPLSVGVCIVHVVGQSYALPERIQMIMFYNGFNLLIDLLIGGLVFYFTRRISWIDGYSAGQDDYREDQERHADWTGWED
jgi:hypothetical protein